MKYCLVLFLVLCACQPSGEKEKFTGKDGEVKLLVLDPGHFHAALLQKTDISRISRQVYVYAPGGSELEAYLSNIESYNHRPDSPTSWEELVYTGGDYLEKMIAEKKGNVVILAGNNRKKADYISTAIAAGISVLSDKPMAINTQDFGALEKAFGIAREKGVILYDMMTERFDVTNRVQRDIIHSEDLFGTLLPGSAEAPSVELESIHHFLKTVSGKPLVRPAWYYDVEQQGEGIVDVTTHLVDMVHWTCFPERLLDYRKDIQVNDARRWPTKLSPADFKRSTQLDQYPDFLKKYIVNDTLSVYANGCIYYKVSGIQVKVTAVWLPEAAEGSGDTYRSVFRGSKAALYILQEKEQQFQPQLYLEKNKDVPEAEFLKALAIVMNRLQQSYPGISAVPENGRLWIQIPSELKSGHEAHFSQLTRNFLDYLVDGKLPDWEVPQMQAKYYITTRALEIARQKSE